MTTTFYTNNGMGATPGTTVNGTNSALGGDPDNVALVASGTRTYSTEHVAATVIADFTSQVFKCVSATGAAALIGPEPGATNAELADAAMSGSIFVLVETLPATTFDCIRMRTIANGNAGKVQLRTDGKLNLLNNAGSIIGTTTAALATNTWYRLDFRIVKGSGSSGVLQMRLCLANSPTPVEAALSNLATDCGTSDIVGFRGGELSGITGGHSVWLALPRLEQGGTTLFDEYIGPSKLGIPGRTDWRAFNFPDLRGTISIEQTSTGTEVDEPDIDGTTIWINVPKGHPDLLTFDVTAQGDGPEVTFELAIAPRPLHNTALYSGSGDPEDITNWIV